jgi:hypothetical protein
MSTSESQLHVLQESRRYFRAWLDEVARSADPASQLPAEMASISHNVKRVEIALKTAPPALRNSKEWKQAAAEYAETLRELSSRLSNCEITLRIRSGMMAQKRTRLDVVHCWADLVKHLQ